MKKLPLILLSLCSFFGAQAQEFRKCAADEVYQQHLLTNPGLLQTRNEIEAHTNSFIQNYNPNSAQRAVITIPVVFHVLYRNTTQNISDAQILSQIEVLNEDFRLLNADFAAVTPAVFEPLAADFEIEFCLASIDPSGNPTTGINRVSTTDNGFDTDDQIKFTAQGGTNAWPRDKYLNIWVGDLSGASLLGYAQFPGDPAATDGVVLHYETIGRPPANNFNTPYNLGRTATHEVGHWLNLYHIWGNENAGCGTSGTGTDQVADTPVQDDANTNCPSHPQPSCNNGGDMFVNYMDYCPDACLSMFTAGQKVRSLALFATGGDRASLLTSNGCSGSVQPPPTPTCLDTLNFPMPGTESILIPSAASGETGFISGTNTYNDKGKYSKFTVIGGNNILIGSYFKFGVATLNNAPANTQITVKVYDATGTGGSPGTVLSTTTIPFSLITQTVSANNYVNLTYNTPLTVPNAFFIGIDLNIAAGYDLALYTNLDGEVTTNSAWEQFSDNTWHQYSETASWGISVDHAIHPIMGAPAPVATFTVNDNSICIGQTVTYTASGGGIASYNWSFPGGTPSTSTTASQIVTYPTAGNFSATLAVTGTCDGSSVSQTNTNLLTVTNLPAVPTVTINGAQLVSSSATGNQWLRNGTAVNGATAQTYTPIQNGNYTVRVTSNGCFSISSAVNVNFVGIDYLVTNNVQVYPNPAKDELFIQAGFEKTESFVQCILLDISGKMVIDKTFNNVIPTQLIALQTNNLSAGVYQLIIQSSKDRITRKVAIAR
jgi:hypothetical protein